MDQNQFPSSSPAQPLSGFSRKAARQDATRPSSSHANTIRRSTDGTAGPPPDDEPVEGVVQWPTTDALPGSPLLTSEPLNRSSSQAPMSRPVKRRMRAQSLPSADPLYKRRRCGSGPEWPTPSEQIARSYAARKREPSASSRNAARARVLGERLLAGRPLRGGCRPGKQIIIAARQPPVNVKTLRALDASEILRNPQLRHDLLFDTLAFRPVAVDDGPRSCAVTDMYWESIAAEINIGCRCTRWQVSLTATLDAQGIRDKERMTDCICGQWRHDLSEDEWFKKNRGWASRLPDLILALREILVSLMGSTTPCLDHFAHSYTREALDLHERTCPTVTHALVPQLYEALEPDFIIRRVRRGAFDMHIFVMLGEAMKVHCAPIRDDMVDDMVRTAGSDVALGLRKCFDCVEVMKLDIANHQVHALRPHLWTSAAQDEMTAYRAHASSSVTKTWIRAASMRVLAEAEPNQRTHLIGSCPCKDRSELVLRSVVDGFIKLVFSEWKGAWPPVSHRRMMAMGTVISEERSVVVPETLRMDVRRIRGFYAEAIEVSTICLVLLACRDMLTHLRPTASAAAIKADLAVLNAELESIAATQPLTITYVDGEHSELGVRVAGRLLDFAKIEARGAQIDTLAHTFDTFMRDFIRPDHHLFKLSMERVEQAVRLVLTNELLRSRTSESSCRARPKRDARVKEDELFASLSIGHIATNVRDLAGRMEKIVSFNAGVFMDVYGEKGMVVGA